MAIATCYALTCRPTGKAYIGITLGKMAKRMREHRCLLRAGKHTSALLQADWDHHGETEFDCITLAQAEVEPTVGNLRQIEQQWIDQYVEAGKLYNAYKTSFRVPDRVWRMGIQCAHNEPGNRWTPEANERRRIAQLGKPKGHGAKISATKQAKKAMR